MRVCVYFKSVLFLREKQKGEVLPVRKYASRRELYGGVSLKLNAFLISVLYRGLWLGSRPLALLRSTSPQDPFCTRLSGQKRNVYAGIFGGSLTPTS